MEIYPYPFLVVITQLLSWKIFINECIYINWFTWIIFFMIIYVILKIGGNENSPNSIKVTVNCHYHIENRVIIQ